MGEGLWGCGRWWRVVWGVLVRELWAVDSYIYPSFVTEDCSMCMSRFGTDLSFKCYDLLPGERFKIVMLLRLRTILPRKRFDNKSASNQAWEDAHE